MSAMAQIVYVAAYDILPRWDQDALNGKPLGILLSKVSTTLVGCTL
jgi:hypothetical protein